MKPFHWTLLAFGLASCRATGGGPSAGPLGPGSRPVVPSLAQPKVEEAAPTIRMEVQPPIDPPAASRADAPPPLKLLATVLSQTLVRMASAIPPPPVQPSAPIADPGASPSSEQPQRTEAAPSAGEPRVDGTPMLQGEAELVAAADQALADHRWKDLREYSERLFALPSLDRARRLHQEARFDEELVVIEQALAETPGQPELLEAAGYARLTLATAGRTELYGPARDAFARAGATPTALLGQSRAARALGFQDEALDCARRALALLSVRQAERLALDPAAEVVLAEAGLEVQRRLRATPGTEAAAQLSEIETALRSRMAEKSTDARAFATLAEIYLDVGKIVEAQSAAERGLVSSPGDARLMGLVARATLSISGTEGLIRIFQRLQARASNQPLVYWYPALEYFRCSASRDWRPQFEGNWNDQLKEAERNFQRVRQLDPRYLKSCLEYEALCKAVRGWILLDSGKLNDARVEFLSMTALGPGLLTLDPSAVDPQSAGRIPSGIAGLKQIAERYRDQKKLVESAAVFADLAQQLPGDAQCARASAESAQTAADFLADEAEWFGKASRKEVLDPKKLKSLRKSAGVKESDFDSRKERERFAKAVPLRLKSSADAYAASWGWYLRAVELAPLDARLATDAARMAINHTRTDLSRAEELLLGARRLADEQCQAADLKPAERDQLKVAWALAERTLGELEFPIRDNPIAAIPHFERSLEIHPDSQAYVKEFLLPKAIEASKKLPSTPETPPRQDQD